MNLEQGMLCPICHAGEGFVTLEYFRCANCGVLRTRYDYDSCIYNAHYSANYRNYALTPINTNLQLCRLGMVAQRMQIGGYLLDIGCCIAEFIRFAEKYYPCVGFEPNGVALDHAKSRVRSTIHQFLSYALKEQKYSVITMFDVLEHIEHPEHLIGYIREFLADGGHVIVTTPNVSPQANEDLHRWKHYKPTEHLWLHTVNSLNHLFQMRGYKPVSYSFEESLIRPGNPKNDIMTFVARKNDS